MVVRHYNLMLTTVGPVHIGDGGRYGKKDYFAEGGRVAVLDAPAFIAKLDDRQMSEYLAFLEAPESNKSSIGLQELLRDDEDLKRKALASVRYWTNTELARAPRGSKNFYPVATFVKDSEGRPYVPGSSVKGMIRTALLTSLIMNERGMYAALYNDAPIRDKNRMANSDARIDQKAVWRECPDAYDSSVVNDIMRHVSVSDSDPLEIEDLIFVQKFDKFAKGDTADHKLNMGKAGGRDYAEGNKLNIYRECLRPGVEVTVSLDVDDRIDQYLDEVQLDAAGLERVLRDWLGLYDKCFLRHFDIDDGDTGSDGSRRASRDGLCCYVAQAGPFAGRPCRNQAVGDTGYCNMHKDKAAEAGGIVRSTEPPTCYLGGGVDFASKTVVNAIFDDEGERLSEMAHILFGQFPSEFVPHRFRGLEEDVRKAGFSPGRMNQRGKQAKNDHRHWKDEELGVSPHTLKMGIVGGKKLPMGKCSLKIEER